MEIMQFQKKKIVLRAQTLALYRLIWLDYSKTHQLGIIKQCNSKRCSFISQQTFVIVNYTTHYVITGFLFVNQINRIIEDSIIINFQKPSITMLKINHLFLLLLIFYFANSQDAPNQMNGPGNVVHSGTGNVANGKDNSFRGDNNTANGSFNNFVGNTNNASGLANQIHGLKNNVNGSVNNVEGESNQVKGQVNDIYGKDNKVNGSLNSVDGKNNQVSGVVNQVSGSNNQVKGLGNCVEGRDNQVIGSGNIVSNNMSGEDQQKMLDNIQKMILSRLSRRFGQ